ncbi:nuclear transport factor 2 family protein [Nocardia alni]|uniref:nuclear transport factor 2 family protein n=1 Tax=Nocardia alni TaxID=2815723 RepID=UPI001C234C7A|nr:nuclear transport factor 2 family protein [Nocardia alni]
MVNETRSNTLDSVLAYHRAWTSGDIDAAMEHVADDIVCRAPGAELKGKDAYRGFLGAFAPTLTGLTDVSAFGDDDHVVLFYYPHTAITSDSPTAEHFTIRDGKIAESLLVFDRMSFLPPQA